MGVGPVRVYLGASLVWAAGLYGFFSFPGSVLAGMVRLKWWRWVLCFSFHFPQFVVSSLGGWICAVGILRYIFLMVSCSGFLRFLTCKLLIVDNSLQVASESSAP